MTALLFLAILTTYLFARNATLRALAREDGRVIRAQRRELECHRRTWRDVEQAMEVALQTIALAATVAAEIRGRECGVCGERTRRLAAHTDLQHRDERGL